jgi:phage tail-like protein
MESAGGGVGKSAALTRKSASGQQSNMAVDKAKRMDPCLGFRFLVEIEGLIEAGFSEVSGLQSRIETEAYREGGVNDFVHQLPTGAQYTNLTLKKGVVDYNLLQWHRKAVNGDIQRKNLRLVILDEKGVEAQAWEVRDAFPVQWQGPELRADQDSVAVEAVELSHQGIEKS